MKKIISQLPPEIARQIHPDRRKNEEGYWAARDQLLEQYRGLWIGFANGAVIASGTSAVAVLQEGEATGLRPFFVCVGKEEEPSRIRRISFPYDPNYSSEPLPVASVEFRTQQIVQGVVFDRVIPDTGADASVLPWIDCQQLQLTPTMGFQTLISGVGGSAIGTLAFLVWVQLDGQILPCRLQADFVGAERILGRDVLNRVDMLFRGPAGEVVINP